MLNVSQAWRDNQKKQLQNESNVKLLIFANDGSGNLTLKETLDKDSISAFNYTESGSIIGRQLPDVEMFFEVIKNGIVEYQFKRGDVVQVNYGYYLNGAWEYHEKGLYEITSVVIKQNNMTAKYICKYLYYDTWQQTFSKGSGNLTMNTNTGSYTSRSPHNFINTWWYKSVFGFTSYAEFDYGNMLPKWFDENYALYYLGHRCKNSYKNIEVGSLMANSMGGTMTIKGSLKNTNEAHLTLKFNSYNNSYFAYHLNDCVKLYNINNIAFPEIVKNEVYNTLVYQYYKYSFNTGSTFNTPKWNTKRSMRVQSGTSDVVLDSGFVIGSTNNGSVSSGFSYGSNFTITTSSATDVELWYSIDDTLQTSYTIGNDPYGKTITIMDNFEWGEIRTYASNWLTRPLTYEYQLRIDPSIELYDLVKDVENNTYFVVEGISFSYNGGSFKGKLTLKEVDLTLLQMPESDFIVNTNNVGRWINVDNPNDEKCYLCWLLEDGTKGYYTALAGTGAYNDFIHDEINAESSGSTELYTSGIYSTTNINTLYNNYLANQLNQNVYFYFEGEFGEVSDLVLVWEANGLSAPVLNDLQTTSPYSFRMTNPNPKDLKLVIEYTSSDSETLDIEKNDTLKVSGTKVNTYFGRYANYQLTDDIYGYLKTADNSIVSSSVRILKANKVLPPEIVDESYSDPDDFYWVIYNPNSFAVQLKVIYSGGTLSFDLDVGETFYLDNNNASALRQTIEYWHYGLQHDSIIAHFERDGIASSNMVLLQ